MSEIARAREGWLSSAITNYDPDEDIASAGGSKGMFLAEIIFRKNMGFFTGLDGRVCDSDAVVPELREEHEHFEKPKHNASDYAEFYLKAKDYNPGQHFSNISDKKRLLISHFPRRFGDKGKQPIVNYGDAEIGKLFDDIFAYATKYAPSQVR